MARTMPTLPALVARKTPLRSSTRSSAACRTKGQSAAGALSERGNSNQKNFSESVRNHKGEDRHLLQPNQPVLLLSLPRRTIRHQSDMHYGMACGVYSDTKFWVCLKACSEYLSGPLHDRKRVQIRLASKSGRWAPQLSAGSKGVQIPLKTPSTPPCRSTFAGHPPIPHEISASPKVRGFGSTGEGFWKVFGKVWPWSPPEAPGGPGRPWRPLEPVKRPGASKQYILFAVDYDKNIFARYEEFSLPFCG